MARAVARAEAMKAKPGAAKPKVTRPKATRSKVTRHGATEPARADKVARRSGGDPAETRRKPEVGLRPGPQADASATALSVPAGTLGPEMQAYLAKCDEKIGFVPNVLAAYAFDDAKLSAFAAMYNDLMLAPSGLSKLEREMIAVAVSSHNRCYYCLVAHGAAVRQLSGDPLLGEKLVMNFRAASLEPRHRAMLDFAVKLTERPFAVEEEDRARLREVGFGDRDIWDIGATAAFYNMTNRMASAVDMRPNGEYHAQAR